jgi:photosystem II stability/assembly factor-like uncharacterized protein
MKRALLPVLLASCLAAACSSHGPEATAAAPTSTRSTSAAPSVTAPRPAGEVPDGFVPVSATFVSDRIGWVLGTVPCADSAGCDVVAGTRDGGGTWTVVGKPTDTGGGDLRFADERDGFLLTGGLSETHDGGRTWHDVDTLRDVIHEPWSAEAARGQLWLTGRIDHGGRGLWVSSVRRASFDFAPVTLPNGDLDDLMLSLHGPAVVLAFLDGRASAAVVSEDGDTFVRRPLPCAPSGPLALRTTWHYLLVCNSTLFSTVDAGRTWQGLDAPADGVPLVTPDAVFVVGDHTLSASRDGGRSWQQVEQCQAPCAIRMAGFESARLGFVIQGGEHASELRLSHDDGRTWVKVDFRRTPKA